MCDGGKYFHRVYSLYFLTACLLLMPASASGQQPAATGLLSITTDPPGLEIFLDGRSIGKTPIDRLRMVTGNYEAKIKYPCYPEMIETVEVGAGEDVEMMFDLY